MARDTGTDAPPLVGYILRAFDPDLDRGQPSIWCNHEEYVAEKPKWTELWRHPNPEKVEDTTNHLLKAAEDRKKLRDDKKDVQPMVVDENEFGEQGLFRDKTDEWDFKNPPKDNYLKEFDDGVKGLTERRGDVYGHPQDDFDRIIQMQNAVCECDDEFARHIMNMIAVKMSRLVKTPDHADSWIDIVGYVRTWFMIQERRKEDE